MAEGSLTRSKDSLEAEARRFIRRLRKAFAEAITEDAQGFKRRLRRLVCAGLPPFAGRPPDPAISRAIQLRKQGQEWKEIYPQVIPLHSELDPIRRQHAEFNLRSAVRSRRNSARRRGNGHCN